MKPIGLKSYDKKTKKAVFECSVPGTRGHKRIRKVVRVKDQADLNEQLHAFRSTIKGGETPIVDVPTLRAYVTEHWETYATRLSTAKRKSNDAILEHHLLPILGSAGIDRITAAHAEDVISAMRKKKHDAAS
jgi:Phage integrase, N-terminal SAM-like domain